MKPAEDMTCGNCYHSVLMIKTGNVIDIDMRECKRFPPSIFPVPVAGQQIGFVAARPQVNIYDLCGEWEPRLNDSA